jgi:hypothetical protein
MEQVSRIVDWEALKTDLEGILRQIPKAFRTDRSIHGTLQCYLYRRLSDAGFRVIADYLPPRVQDRSVDLIALDREQKIVYAVCLDTVITLYAVKSLTSFEAANRLILTTGILERKVQESRFFLKPEIAHIHLRFSDRL